MTTRRSAFTAPVIPSEDPHPLEPAKQPKSGPTGRAADVAGGTTYLSVRVPSALAKQLKLAAANDGTSQQAIVTELLTDYLRDR